MGVRRSIHFHRQQEQSDTGPALQNQIPINLPAVAVVKVHALERRKRLVMVPKRLLEHLLECK